MTLLKLSLFMILPERSCRTSIKKRNAKGSASPRQKKFVKTALFRKLTFEMKTLFPTFQTFTGHI